jgi:hypothetical protein
VANISTPVTDKTEVPTDPQKFYMGLFEEAGSI